MKTAEELKLKHPVDATYLSAAVKEYLVPAKHDKDGVKTPVSIVALVDPTKSPVVFVKPRPWGNGIPIWTRDAAANDSDKSFTVPVGKVWDLRYLWAEITTTATVGNRTLVATVSNGTNLVFTTQFTAPIAASKRGILITSFRYWTFALSTGVRYLTDGNAADVEINDGAPEMLLPAGYIVRVYDRGTVDVGADDMTVNLHYVEYDA